MKTEGGTIMAVLEMEEGRMQVCRDGAPIYDIVLEDSFDRLPEEMERLGSQGRKLCIVTAVSYTHLTMWMPGRTANLSLEIIW